MRPDRILIVPGWRNSEPGHWQSLWEARLPGARRVAQADWLFPRRQEWVDRLAEDILASADERVVLVAHSLGCMAVAHLPEEASQRVSAALLVAPADPERRSQLADFAPVPHRRLPYRSTLVARATIRIAPFDWLVPTQGHGAANSSGWRTPVTSTWPPVLASGHWGCISCHNSVC